MKKYLILPVIAFALAGSVASAATIFNGGAAGTAGSWSNGLPSVDSSNAGTIAVNGTINSNLTGWEVTQTAGILNGVNSNRSWGAVTASSTLGMIWNLQGGTLDFGTYTLNRGNTGSNYAYTMNMSGGSFLAGNVANSAGAIWNVSGGSINSTTWLSGAGGLNLTGGTHTIGTLDMDGSGALVTFGTGTSSLSVTTSLVQNSNTNINFLTGSGGSLSITGFTSTDYSTMWGNGRLDFNGSNTGTFGDIFSVTGSTLTLVPEPTTWALLAGSLTALVVFRRRRNS